MGLVAVILDIRNGKLILWGINDDEMRTELRDRERVARFFDCLFDLGFYFVKYIYIEV